MKVWRRENGNLNYWCPACQRYHWVSASHWIMLGSSEDPTITPAFTFRSDEDASVCHHMISHGRLYYFEDSTHEMRGQCVEMQELTDGLTVMCQEVPAAFTADPSQLFLDFIADL